MWNPTSEGRWGWLSARGEARKAQHTAVERPRKICRRAEIDRRKNATQLNHTVTQFRLSDVKEANLNDGILQPVMTLRRIMMECSVFFFPAFDVKCCHCNNRVDLKWIFLWCASETDFKWILWHSNVYILKNRFEIWVKSHDDGLKMHKPLFVFRKRAFCVHVSITHNRIIPFSQASKSKCSYTFQYFPRYSARINVTRGGKLTKLSLKKLKFMFYYLTLGLFDHPRAVKEQKTESAPTCNRLRVAS